MTQQEMRDQRKSSNAHCKAGERKASARNLQVPGRDVLSKYDKAVEDDGYYLIHPSKRERQLLGRSCNPDMRETHNSPKTSQGGDEQAPCCHW
eukprot:611137-Amphidinium_carterae.1